MEQKNKRFWNTVTVLNLFFSIMICLYHNNGYSFYDDGTLSKGVMDFIDISHNGYLANIPVPLFIFLSGFLFYRNIAWDNVKDKMLSRVKSLVIPYISWNIITGGVLFLMQSIPFIRSRIAVRELVNFDVISIIKGITISPYDGVLWTILQLILFVAVAPVLYWLVKNRFVGIIVLFMAFALGFTGWKIPLLIHGNEHLFTYLFGAYIGLHYYKKIQELDFKSIHCSIAIALTIVLCILYEFDVYNVLCRIVGIGALYLLAWSVAGYTTRASEVCYGLSFWIYAIHDWLEPCIMKLWFMTGVKGNIGALIATFGCAAITIVICIICAKTCKRMIPKLYGILSGGRG